VNAAGVQVDEEQNRLDNLFRRIRFSPLRHSITRTRSFSVARAKAAKEGGQVYSCEYNAQVVAGIGNVIFMKPRYADLGGRNNRCSAARVKGFVTTLPDAFGYLAECGSKENTGYVYKNCICGFGAS
jgi:hypothetical protein